MRLIEEEDKVKICYNEGYDIGTVKHVPQDIGDWWYLRIDGKMVGLNPMSSGILKIEVIKKAVKNKGNGEVSG